LSNRESCSCPTCGKPTTLYAWRDAKPTRTPLAEKEAYRRRVMNLVAEFQLGGYTTYEKDTDTACALATIMAAEGEKPHLQRLLAFHMERIAAASIAGLT
jgi:hypothetical protein